MFLPWFPSLRSVDSIKSFTRETLSAVIVDIKSRDWQQHYNKQKGIPTEHPRASTSDDVECFLVFYIKGYGWKGFHAQGGKHSMHMHTYHEMHMYKFISLIPPMYSRLCLSGEKLVRNSPRGLTLTSCFSTTPQPTSVSLKVIDQIFVSPLPSYVMSHGLHEGS